MRGLGHQLVVNHISKYNYGIANSVPFDQNKHNIKDRKFDATLGYWAAKNQMRWFLTRVTHFTRYSRTKANQIVKGENVCKAEPVKHNFFFAIERPEDLDDLKIRIYCSNSMEAESRVNSSQLAVLLIARGSAYLLPQPSKSFVH